MPLHILEKYKLLYKGLLTAILGSAIYFFYGYNSIVAIFWAFSLLLTCRYFWMISKNKKSPLSFNRRDVLASLALFTIFAPLYLTFLSSLPYQINTDEILLTGLTETKNITPTLLGLSNYLHIPSFIFVLYRFILSFRGEINIESIRALHATSGLIIIIVSYFFFKLFRSWQFALVGAVLLGSQHVFLAISRMALIHNPAVLLELLSLIFLINGLKKNSAFYSYIGGIIAGFSVYNHITSTTAIILWVLLIGISAIFFKNIIKLQTLIKHSLVSLLGILIVALPFFVSYLNLPPNSPSYYKKQILIFPEGGQQLYGKNYLDIVKSEAIKVITIFNNNLPDTNNIYPNPGHGFVDPLTGILVWIGFAIILFKRGKSLGEILIIAAFILLMAIFGFLVNKAPHYNRMQIILPFAIFLAVEAISFISHKLPQFRKFIFISFVSTIVILNLNIYADFIKMGYIDGDVFGATIRYVEARKNLPYHSFLIAADEKSRYFPWHHNWISPLENTSQSVIVIDPQKLQDATFNNPFSKNFTIFTSIDVWEQTKNNLSSLFPNLIFHEMMPNGSKIAIEVN